MTSQTTIDSPRITGRQLIDRTEALLPLLRAHAATIEDRRCLTPEVHEALLEAGVYRMTMPPEFGGPDMTLAEAMRVLETLARGDGSTAWSVWAALGVPAMSAFTLEDGAREMFEPRQACIVGSIAAMGRAVAVDGGFLVSGRWPFVSGVHQATFVGGTCFVFDGEQQRMSENGPYVIVPVWPADACRIVGVWDTTGLRGTGSDTVEIEEVFVPEQRVVDFTRPPRPGLNPVHYMHVDNAANVTVAAIGLGIGAAAVDAFRALGPKRKLANGETLSESALGKLALARAELSLAEARGHLYEVAETLGEELQMGAYKDEPWFPRTSLASVRAVDAAIAAATTVYRAAGTSAIFRANVFDRCLRDLFTLGAHKTVQHVNELIHGGAGFAP